MNFDANSGKAKIFIPDRSPLESALARTTHIAIAAHQDDIEMMAAHPILECYRKKELWFTGIVMTDGRGSPRAGKYKDFTDEEMGALRTQEQFKAAAMGKYSAQIVLGYPSEIIKCVRQKDPVDDLLQILQATKPRIVYTHNLADKHDTHVAVALRVIEAIRALPLVERPEGLFGCEVWRGLDWLSDGDKVLMDLSEHEDLQVALLEVFDSQIGDGKRYNLATMGRRRANATFYESHTIDTTSSLAFAMDMSPFIDNANLEPSVFVQNLIERFARDVDHRLKKLS